MVQMFAIKMRFPMQAAVHRFDSPGYLGLLQQIAARSEISSLLSVGYVDAPGE